MWLKSWKEGSFHQSAKSKYKAGWERTQCELRLLWGPWRSLTSCVLISVITGRYWNAQIINSPQGDCKDSIPFWIKLLCAIHCARCAELLWTSSETGFHFYFPWVWRALQVSVPSRGCATLCTDNELEIAISHLLLALLWNLILPCPFLISLSTGGVPRGSGKWTAQNLDKTAAFWNKKMGVMGWEMSRNCLASSVLIKHLSGWLMLETLGFQLF